MMSRREDLPEWRAARAIYAGNTEIMHGSHDEQFHRSIQGAQWMNMLESAKDQEELSHAR